MVRPGARAALGHGAGGRSLRGRHGEGSARAVAQEHGLGRDRGRRGRIRLKRLPGTPAASVKTFPLEAFEPGSVIGTDGWRSFARLRELGYRHDKGGAGGDPGRMDRDLSRVHQGAALLKRWLLGTHQGSVEKHHLDDCPDEFTFRFNRGSSPSRGLQFCRFLQRAVATDPVPRWTILGGSRARRVARESDLEQSTYIRPQHIGVCTVKHLAQLLEETLVDAPYPPEGAVPPRKFLLELLPGAIEDGGLGSSSKRLSASVIGAYILSRPNPFSQYLLTTRRTPPPWIPHLMDAPASPAFWVRVLRRGANRTTAPESRHLGSRPPERRLGLAV